MAHGRSESEVEQYLGCDWLIYQELDDLVAAVADGNEALTRFDTSCFSGEYVTGLPDGYLAAIAAQRADGEKAKRRG